MAGCDRPLAAARPEHRLPRRHAPVAASAERGRRNASQHAVRPALRHGSSHGVLPAGCALGTVGLALVWVVVFPLLVLPAYRRVLQVIELSSGEYLRALWPAASASLIMGAAVVAVERAAGAAQVSRVLGFSAQVAVGAIAYTLVCAALHRARIAAFFQLLRAMRQPGPAREVSVAS